MTNSSDTSPIEPSRRGRRPILIAAVVLIVVIGAVVGFILGSGNDDGSASPADQTSPSESPTATPATTDQSVPATTNPAESTPVATPTTTEAGATPNGVAIRITSQSWNAQTTAIEVVGAVEGVATESSTCVATASRAGVTASGAVAGMFDGNATSCGLISIPMAGQAAGEWTVTIEFSYSAGTVMSAPVTVQIP